MKKTTRADIIASMEEATEILERTKHRSTGRVSHGACILLIDAGLYPQPFLNIAEHWEHHSTRNLYPVPHPDHREDNERRFSAAKWAFEELHPWQGEYGKLRRDLCQFVAREIREALRQGRLIDFRMEE